MQCCLSSYSKSIYSLQISEFRVPIYVTVLSLRHTTAATEHGVKVCTLLYNIPPLLFQLDLKLRLNSQVRASYDLNVMTLQDGGIGIQSPGEIPHLPRSLDYSCNNLPIHQIADASIAEENGILSPVIACKSLHRICAACSHVLALVL